MSNGTHSSVDESTLGLCTEVCRIHVLPMTFVLLVTEMTHQIGFFSLLLIVQLLTLFFPPLISDDKISYLQGMVSLYSTCGL